MNKIWASVVVDREKNAEFLVTSFFEDFNPESSITIKGDTAKMEIFFESENPPMKLLSAISQCKIEELFCGKILREEENSKTIKSVNSKSQTHETYESEYSKSKTLKTCRSKVSNSQIHETLSQESSLPELDELAKKATSVENFAELVADWLKIDQKREFFTNLIILSTEIDKVSWKNLQNGFKEKNVEFSDYYKILCSKRIAKTLKNRYVSLLTLLYEVNNRFKEYDFKSIENAPVQNKVETELSVEKLDNSESRDFPRIPNLEEILGSVDMTQPIEERVRYVLESMGLEKSSQECRDFVAFATTAIKEKHVSIDETLVKVDIPAERAPIVRMLFAEFINTFASKYGHNTKVKLVDFLVELQKFIVLEDEFDNS